MNLAKDSFVQFAKNTAFFDRNGIRIRMLGRVEALPPDVQEALFKVEADTAHNNEYTLNMYICYDSTMEFSDSLKVMEGEYSEEKFEKGFYGGRLVSPDIIM
jgi:undecaprenyl diphosphate synthase